VSFGGTWCLVGKSNVCSSHFIIVGSSWVGRNYAGSCSGETPGIVLAVCVCLQEDSDNMIFWHSVRGRHQVIGVFMFCFGLPCKAEGRYYLMPVRFVWFG